MTVTNRQGPHSPMYETRCRPPRMYHSAQFDFLVLLRNSCGTVAGLLWYLQFKVDHKLMMQIMDDRISPI